jgi:hypothetical protein
MSRTSDTPSAAPSAGTTSRAPHVEEKWAEAFVIELRLLDIPGDALGDALAEVESHCAESGESAAEAFGDPVAYARSLDLPAQPIGRWDAVHVLGPAGAQTLGLTMLLWGALTIAPVGFAARGDLPLGLLLVLPAVVGAGLVLLRRGARALRFALDRPLVAALVVTLATLAIGLGSARLDGVVATLPALPVAGAGGVLLAAGTGWSLVQDRRGTLADPIVSPLTGEDVGHEPGSDDSAAGRRVLRLLAWAPALGAVVVIALTWLLSGR